MYTYIIYNIESHTSLSYVQHYRFIELCVLCELCAIGKINPIPSAHMEPRGEKRLQLRS